MSQVQLFFCLYADKWRDPPRCNSNHSRLMGFFTTLPAIWRALQCLRRFYDTRNAFPHLANCLKYVLNLLYYMSLSMYRIRITAHMRAVFILFAALNSLYCTFWDVAYDFSLGNPYAPYPFLRERLAYRRVWAYYAIIVVDVVLRQQWILYALFTHDLQHSAVMSFGIGVAEAIRRGLWSLFRVENEHCNNVGKFRASRDIPLPYLLPGRPGATESEEEHVGAGADEVSAEERRKMLPPISTTTGADIERGRRRAPTETEEVAIAAELRRRKSHASIVGPGFRTLQRVGTVISAAHEQDYEKKRRPEVVGQSPGLSPRHGRAAGHGGGHDDSSEDDEDDDEDDANHNGNNNDSSNNGNNNDSNNNDSSNNGPIPMSAAFLPPDRQGPGEQGRAPAAPRPAATASAASGARTTDEVEETPRPNAGERSA